MTSILITGGTGYLGRAIVEHLLTAPFNAPFRQKPYDRICIYSRGEHAQAEMRANFQDDPRLRWFIGDVRDQARLHGAMRGIVHVVHAAALKRVEVGQYNPGEMLRTNCDGTDYVAQACVAAGVRRAVLVSSDKAVEPVNTYGASKMLAEALWRGANVPGRAPFFNVVRYGNVAGSTGSVIPTWRAALERGETPVVRDPWATRFWLTRERAVELVFEAMTLDGSTLLPELRAFQLRSLAEVLGIGVDPDECPGLDSSEKRHERLEVGCAHSGQSHLMTVEELRDELERL